jgi:hypothetical protein
VADQPGPHHAGTPRPTLRRGQLVRLRDDPTTVMRVHGLLKIAGQPDFVSVGRDGGVLYPLIAVEPATRFDDPRLYGPLICDPVARPFTISPLATSCRQRTEWPDTEFCAA